MDEYKKHDCNEKTIIYLMCMIVQIYKICILSIIVVHTQLIYEDMTFLGSFDRSAVSLSNLKIILI